MADAITPADLRERRAALGMTQPQLAAALGVSPSTLAHWEQGHRTISLPTVLRLALDWLAAHPSARQTA